MYDPATFTENSRSSPTLPSTMADITFIDPGSYDYPDPEFGEPSAIDWSNIEPMETSCDPSLATGNFSCVQSSASSESSGTSQDDLGYGHHNCMPQTFQYDLSVPSSQEEEALRAIISEAQAQLALPGPQSLFVIHKLLEAYSGSPSPHLVASNPVQDQTEEPCSTKQNPTIFHTDGYHPDILRILPPPHKLPFLPHQPPATSTHPPLSALTDVTAPEQFTDMFVESLGPRVDSANGSSVPYSPPYCDGSMVIHQQEPYSERSLHAPRQSTRIVGPSRRLDRGLVTDSTKKTGHKKPLRAAPSYRCKHPGCGTWLSSISIRLRHMKMHRAPNPRAKCRKCTLQCSRVDSLRRHERSIGACDTHLRSLLHQ